MNGTPYHMWEAKCEECKCEMMPNESIMTQSTDHLLKKKKLERIEIFICPECGAEMKKTYEEEFEPND